MKVEDYDILRSFEYPELARRYEFSAMTWGLLEEKSDREWESLASRGTSKAGVPSISERACIYVTGSLARFEAEKHSDIDLFVIDKIDDRHERLTYVENSHLISSLDHVRSEIGFRPFSAGGKYIGTHSLDDIIKQTGSQQDDALNTFTARILLLINSKCLLNQTAYESAWERVLDRYWQRFDPQKPYLPIMLMNDIRRWWGVLGLNFEKNYPKNQSNDHDMYDPNPEREIANLKLRYSRLLACYSVLVAFVYRSTRKGILRDEAKQILQLAPVERLIFLHSMAGEDAKPEIRELVGSLLRQYDDYLALAATPHEKLVELFKQEAFRHEQKDNAYRFHHEFFKLFQATGELSQATGDCKLLYEYAVL